MAELIHTSIYLTPYARQIIKDAVARGEAKSMTDFMEQLVRESGRIRELANCVREVDRKVTGLWDGQKDLRARLHRIEYK